MTQLLDFSHRHRAKLFNVVADVVISEFNLLTNGCEAQLKSDIGLNYAVVNVSRDPLALVFCRLRCQPIDKTNVIQYRSDVLDQLQYKAYVRVVHSLRGADHVEAPDGMVLVIERH